MGADLQPEPLLEGIASTMVETSRLRVHCLTSGSAEAVPVVLLHGNVSSNRFWEETMLALPDVYCAIAPDLRGYGLTEPVGVDATRGTRDWSDDLKALADALKLGKFHLVAWSLGAGVAMQYAIDHPEDLLSITLMSPVSPYGFGGTKGAAGTPAYPDFAGSGGGTVNPEFLKRLTEGDRTGESPLSPRSTMNAFYFKPPFRAASDREEAFVSSMLAIQIGDDFYPGDLTSSENWPTVAPGTRGINNAIAPKYFNVEALASIEPKPPVLWVRGAEDQIVSDTSFFDFGFLGQLGAVPGWPGAEEFPPQPMVSQTRHVLDKYALAGGSYEEVVIQDCGHSPHIEKPEEFNAALLAHLQRANS
jgi:pimeloyl-ACP methyl ester carboxylesterase